MAGCSAIAGNDGGTATTADADNATAAANTTEAANETSPTSHEETNSTHSHGNETDTATSNTSAAMTGTMAVMVAGERVNLTGLDDQDAVRVDDARGDKWYANESPTLEAVLSDAGVNATASTLTYGGETYGKGTNGTKIVYRVDGETVTPSEYTLEDGDEVWVLVVTDDSNVSTPGEYIPPEQLHVHGDVNFTVDGEQLDFSRDKYQQAGHNDHFHFEGGHSNPWHAHSAHVTLAYAMTTLEGINMTEDHVTYNGTTYAYDGGNATVSVMVNGKPVEPTKYYLKDGDSVSIEIESTA